MFHSGTATPPRVLFTTLERRMKFEICCSVHGNPVIPAGDELHFLPEPNEPPFYIPEYKGVWTGTYELDWADLYCTGGVGHHRF